MGTIFKPCCRAWKMDNKHSSKKGMLSLSILLGLIFLFAVPSAAQQTGTRCPPAPGRSETCVCQTDRGVIDLTSLSNRDGSAR